MIRLNKKGIPLNYSALSKKSKVHISNKGLPDRLILATESRLFRRTIIFILIFPMIEALLIHVTLYGSQQNVYLYASLFMMAIIIFCLAATKTLVLDSITATSYFEFRLFGIKLRRTKEKLLAKTSIILTPSIHKQNTYQLIIRKQNYVIGKVEEAEETLLFIMRLFQVQTFEQVSQYPDVIPFNNSGITRLLSCKIADTVASNHAIQPLWNSMVWLKILLPLPVFITLGFLLKQLGSD